MIALPTIITGIASIGIDAVITNVVKANLPEVVSLGTKLWTKIGSMAISYAIGKKVTEYIGEDINELATAINNIQPQQIIDAEVVDTSEVQ